MRSDRSPSRDVHLHVTHALSLRAARPQQPNSDGSGGSSASSRSRRNGGAAQSRISRGPRSGVWTRDASNRKSLHNLNAHGRRSRVALLPVYDARTELRPNALPADLDLEQTVHYSGWLTKRGDVVKNCRFPNGHVATLYSLRASLNLCHRSAFPTIHRQGNCDGQSLLAATSIIM